MKRVFFILLALSLSCQQRACRDTSREVSTTQGKHLYEVQDLNALGFLANIVRERKNGSKAYYIINRHINYSNICILSCQFCSFAKKKREAEREKITEYSLPASSDWVSDTTPEATLGIISAYHRRWDKGQPRGDLSHEFVDKTVRGGGYIIVDPIQNKVRHISRAEWEAHPNKLYHGLRASGAVRHRDSCPGSL